MFNADQVKSTTSCAPSCFKRNQLHQIVGLFFKRLFKQLFI